MSNRQDKKMRQLFKRTLGKRIASEIGVLERVVKPRPRWVPLWLWRWLASIVLIIPPKP